MHKRNGKIVFAGLARDVEPFLRQVAQNIAAQARHFSHWALVIIENDSKDGTKRVAQEWIDAANADGIRRAVCISLDGLAARLPVRTERLAFARNHYREVIAHSGLRDFDYLAVMDMDGPNAYPNAMENFVRAVEFLESRDDVAAVFPNQLPVYCDIWALREQNWCPSDCMDEILRMRGEIGEAAAQKKYLFDRQRFIDPASVPIEVESAFGGIGIYKMPSILQARYAGLKPDGSEICEHVPFHEAIRQSGKRFFILPDFLNYTNFEATDFGNHHELRPVSAAGKSANLLAPMGGPEIATPHGACFAQLAGLYARKHPAPILDIGAGIGAVLAQCRLGGCENEYIAAENRRELFALLSTNALLHRNLFGRHRLFDCWRDAKDAGLVRIDHPDAAGILAHYMPWLCDTWPVLWLESDAALDFYPHTVTLQSSRVFFSARDKDLYEAFRAMSGSAD